MRFLATKTDGAQSFWERDHGWALAAIALTLRLAVFVFILLRFGDAGFILPPFSDGLGYVTIGNNILEGNGFSRDEQPPFTPDIKRVPLYTLYLAATFALSGGGWWLAALLQCVMGAGLVLLLYRVSETFAGRRAAFFAAALAAVYPFSVFLSTQILTETLFTLVLFGSFAVFLQALSKPRYRSFAVAGILFGIATLVKPAAQYIPFLLLPFTAFRGVGIRRLLYPILFILFFFAALSPWLARNHYVSGVATISYEANILFDLHLAGYAALKETGAAGHADEYRTTHSESEVMAASRSDYLRRLFIVGTTDPIGFTKYLLISTVPFVFGDGFVTMVAALSPTQTVPAWNFSTSLSALTKTLGFGVVSPWLIFLSLASKGFWALVLVSALIGCIQLMREGGTQRLAALSFVLVIAYFMFAGGPVQSARYRMPVEPLIFMFAGVGMAYIAHRTRIHLQARGPLSSKMD